MTPDHWDGWAILRSPSGFVGLTTDSPLEETQFAQVRLQIGGASGAFSTDFDNLPDFVADLEKMHQQLSGSTGLRSLYGTLSFSIAVQADGRVDVAVSALEDREGVYECAVDGRFYTDQSYLPSFIAELKRLVREPEE